MYYVTGMIAAPRDVNYISNTLESYFENFVVRPHLFLEPNFDPFLHSSRCDLHRNEQKLGCVHNWLHAIEWLLANTDSERIMMLEDDIEFVNDPRVIDWLKTDFDCASAYCANVNRPVEKGWHESETDAYGLCGSLAMLFKRDVLEELYLNRTFFIDAASNFGKIEKTLHLDFAIGKTLDHLGFKVITHNPTLVLHTGEISTYEANNTHAGKVNKYRIPAL